MIKITGDARGAFKIGLPAMQLLLATRKRVIHKPSSERKVAAELTDEVIVNLINFLGPSRTSVPTIF